MWLKDRIRKKRNAAPEERKFHALENTNKALNFNLNSGNTGLLEYNAPSGTYQPQINCSKWIVPIW